VKPARLAAVVGLLVLVGCGSSGVKITETSVPGSCPEHVEPAPPTKGHAGPLVSAAGIESVVVCRYSGSNTPTTDGSSSQPGNLQQSATVTDAPTVAELVGAVNEGEPWPSGPINCPMDDGRSYELFIHHPRPTGETVIVEASGCQSVQSGSRSHAPTDQLIGILTSIVGAAQ
jgi:hypothetical protein